MRKKDSSNTLFLIVVLAAVIGALSTCVVFFLRLRSKRKAMLAYNEAFDYDDNFDDCDYFISTDFDGDDEPIQIMTDGQDDSVDDAE